MDSNLINQPINLPLKKIIPIMLLVQLIFFLLVIFAKITISVVIICSIIMIILYLITPNPLVTSIILSVFVAIILPQPSGRSLGIKIEEIFPFITVFFLILTFLQNDYNKRPIGKMGYWLLVFLIIVLISAIRGLVLGRSKMLVFNEIMMFMAWGIYFVVIKSNLSQKDIKNILITIIIAALIVSFYYIYEFVVAGGTLRFRTDQQHILNLSVPMLFAYLIYDSNTTRKIYTVILMGLMIIAVYITLTRSLWLLIPLSILWQYLYFIKKEQQQTKFRQLLFPLIVISTIAFLGLILLTQFGIQNLFGERFASFRVLQYDFSLLARAELTRYVLERIHASPLLGTGLADFLRYQYFPTLGRYNVYWLDSSFFQVLWKTGIVGIIIFLGFLYFFLSRNLFFLKNAKNKDDKIIASGIYFSMAVLIVNGIQSGILVGYRFNFVWAVLFAIIEIKAQELERTINSKSVI